MTITNNVQCLLTEQYKYNIIVTQLFVSFYFKAILVGLGLQHKSVDSLVKDLDLPATQILALFNRIIRKVVQEFTEIQERQVESQMVVPEKEVIMEPTRQTMKQDLVCFS